MTRFLRELDARSKMAVWLAVTLSALLVPAGSPLSTLLAITALLTLASSSTVRWLVLSIKLVLPTALMLIIVNGLLLPPPGREDPVFVLTVPVVLSGVWWSLAIASRLMILAGATVAFLGVTPYLQTATGLRRLGLPVPLVGMFVSSFSMHTLIVRKVHQIVDAQRSRGLRPKGLIGRLRAYIPILRPLVFGLMLGALERSALWQNRRYMRADVGRISSISRPDALALTFAAFLLTYGVVCRWVL